MAWNCTGAAPAYYAIASGQVEYLVRSIPYPGVLVALAFLMGLGKGGVPGMSTSSVALNSLLAPRGHGCLDGSVAMGVPITFIADCTVVVNYARLARWDVIARLLPATGVGVALGTRLMGRLEDHEARLLVGAVLALILAVTLLQQLGGGSAPAKGAPPAKGTPPAPKDAPPPSYATSLWFAAVVGVVGGFATILTNSMGPILNVYLLGLGLDPPAFVGTRATFFTVVNTLKLAQRLAAGSLSRELVLLGAKYGVVSALGVLASKEVIKRMSKRVFMRLEYGLMTYASLKLLDAGFQLGLLP